MRLRSHARLEADAVSDGALHMPHALQHDHQLPELARLSAGLSPEWHVRFSRSRPDMSYFVNDKTGTTTWVRPEAFMEAASPPPNGRTSSTSGGRERTLLLLDLDNTLISSTAKRPPADVESLECAGVDLMGALRPTLAHWCIKRPHLAHFLRTAVLSFDLGVYTASPRVLAEQKVRWIDQDGLLPEVRRFYRCACIRDDKHGLNLKDLRVASADGDTSRILLVEDLPFVAPFQPSNVIPIAPFWGDLADDGLMRLLKLLAVLARSPTPVETLRDHLQLEERARQVAERLPDAPKKGQLHDRHSPCPFGFRAISYLPDRPRECTCTSKHEHNLLCGFFQHLKISTASAKRPLSPSS